MGKSPSGLPLGGNQSIRNFALEIDRLVEKLGGKIIAMVIQEAYERESDSDIIEIPKRLLKKIVSWNEIRPYFDKEVGNDFGSYSLPEFYAWTEDFVLFGWDNDGYSFIYYVPRNPNSHQPSIKDLL